jgi:hypothetical protein
MAFLLGLPVFLIVLICVALFVVHFLPSIIAWRRQAKSLLWIVLLNLFFGWTLIGWVVALVWALNE